MEDHCPGRYCGRIAVNISETNLTQSWGECGICPSGTRTNIEKHCITCDLSPTVYQWLYLMFMAILPTTLHWFFLLSTKSRWQTFTAMHLLSPVLEAIVSAIATILSTEQYGSFSIVTCSVSQISDWYTVFFNPKIQYKTTIPCAQEAVYPLYSMVFLNYLYSLAMLLFLRPLILPWLLGDKNNRKEGHRLIYAGLYFHPILTIVHAVCAGLIYYSYPYILMIASIVCLITYYVKWKILALKDLFAKEYWKQHIFIMTWHFLMLSFTVVAVGSVYTEMNVAEYIPYLAIVPVPFLFYILTEKFTRPDTITSEISDRIFT